MRRLLAHVRSNGIAYLALFVALGGTSYAAIKLPKNSVKAKQIAPAAVGRSELKRGAVDSAKVADGKLLAKDFARGQLPAGPAGPTGPAGRDGVVGEAERWHEVGTPGEPLFENAWNNFGSVYETVAFYKDQLGIVHLKGFANPGTSGTIFTLPAGYRPLKQKYFASATGVATGVDGVGAWISLNPDGRVISGAEKSSDSVGPRNLDGITFRP